MERNHSVLPINIHPLTGHLKSMASHHNFVKSSVCTRNHIFKYFLKLFLGSVQLIQSLVHGKSSFIADNNLGKSRYNFLQIHYEIFLFCPRQYSRRVYKERIAIQIKNKIHTFMLIAYYSEYILICIIIYQMLYS